MKTTLLTLSWFGMALGFASPASAGVVASGGQDIIVPTLSYTHSGGNISPAGNPIQCTVYTTGRVTLQIGDQAPLARNLVFSSAIPSLDEAMVLLGQAAHSRLKPTSGSLPDAGSSRYSGQLGRAQGYKKVLLWDTSFLRARINDSNAAKSLIEFLDLNCSP